MASNLVDLKPWLPRKQAIFDHMLCERGKEYESRIGAIGMVQGETAIFTEISN